MYGWTDGWMDGFGPTANITLGAFARSCCLVAFPGPVPAAVAQPASMSQPPGTGIAPYHGVALIKGYFKELG